MIYAQISSFHEYHTISYLDQMVEFIRTHDMLKLPEGEIEICGRDLFLRVFHYPTSNARRAEDAKFEVHRVYADVHIVLKGAELIQTVFPDSLQSPTEYDEKNDVQLFTAEKDISCVVLKEGEFAVFFPGEPHKPMCYYKDFDSPVAKFVFKVRQSYGE
ncbi:MAG: YhcH/YjgK/YiaL family protein [bacterium]|nr:YhcH/YjgK/YiaL family protein [bacterium]